MIPSEETTALEIATSAAERFGSSLDDIFTPPRRSLGAEAARNEAIKALALAGYPDRTIGLWFGVSRQWVHQVRRREI